MINRSQVIEIRIICKETGLASLKEINA